MTLTMLLAAGDAKTVSDYRLACRAAGVRLHMPSDEWPREDWTASVAAQAPWSAAILVGRCVALTAPIAAALLPRPVVCVIAATALQEIALLNAGAALCLSPAVGIDTILAWTQHLLDRAVTVGPDTFSFVPATRQARYAGRDLSLRPQEYDVLYYLARHGGRTVDADEMLRSGSPRRAGASRRLAVTIHTLRAALAAVGAECWLQTVPNVGYRLSAGAPIKPRRSYVR